MVRLKKKIKEDREEDRADRNRTGDRGRFSVSCPLSSPKKSDSSDSGRQRFAERTGISRRIYRKKETKNILKNEKIKKCLK